MSENKKSLVKNAASEKQVSAAVRKESSREDREIEDLRLVMQTKQGRRAIWRILCDCNVYADIMPNTDLTGFNLGKRHLGLGLIIRINEAGKEFYPLMASESEEE